MAIAAADISDDRALLRHAALCFTVASGLGFIAGALAGIEVGVFVTLSKMTNYALAGACILLSFCILWCAPNGPPRWRPFILNEGAAEFIFGCSATVIVVGGLTALEYRVFS
jgi:hypothetical protein